jgi:hypothetical protein
MLNRLTVSALQTGRRHARDHPQHANAAQGTKNVSENIAGVKADADAADDGGGTFANPYSLATTGAR